MLDRPFYFIIVLWGERFRDYFLDLCLSSLLAPGNLPSLATQQRSRLLVCTRPDDWAAINDSRIFQLVKQYVDPVYLEIPPCPADVDGCVHMGIGHCRALQMAYEAQAYPFVLTPDSIFSNGTVARIQELASQGVELALIPALRFAEEPLFENLKKVGIFPRGRNGAPEPISLDSRKLVGMALASMHSETMTYEWDASYFHSTPSATWWRVPDEDGIVVHSLSWAVALLDFAAVPKHDTSTFDHWTFDGDYVHKNLGNIKRVHLVLDSDEMFIASWAPLSDKPYDLTPQPLLKKRFVGNIVRKARFKSWFHSGVFDPLKQEIFFKPAQWHSRPLNERWTAIETRALTTLLSCVAPPSGTKNVLDAVAKNNQLGISKSDSSQLRFRALQLWLRLRLRGFRLCVELTNQGSRLLSAVLIPPTRFLRLFHLAWIYRTKIWRRMRQVLQGDRLARRRAIWRFRQVAYQMIGRPFREPEPNSQNSTH